MKNYEYDGAQSPEISGKISGVKKLSENPSTPNVMPAPQQLGELIHQVANDVAGFDDLVFALLPAIDGHIELDASSALTLSVALHDIERQAVLQDQVRRLVYGQSAPSLAVTEGGALLVMNQAASEFLSLSPGQALEMLGVSQNDFHQLKKRLYELPGPTLMKLNTHGVDQPPLIMVASYHHELRIFLLTALQQRWPASIDRALEDLFGLSQSERDVLAALSQGQTSEQIAQQRNRAIGTVRQQIKTILQKLGANNQVQAATLGAAVANVIGSPQIASDALPLGWKARG
ncbi:MAG: LuxR C-terminal-related transcriptional regulator [Venatoribacter sp.]